MQVKRLKDIPVTTVTVWLVRAPFVVVLGAIYLWPSREWLRGVLWGMCYLDLLLSGADAAAAAHPQHSHDVGVVTIGKRFYSRLDDLICGAISVTAAAVVDSWLACNVIVLLLGGLYVRFSSWFWWDKVQAAKEAADIDDAPLSEIPAHCDCCCEMPQDEINELAVSSGLRDGRKPRSRELLLTAMTKASVDLLGGARAAVFLPEDAIFRDPRGDGDDSEDDIPPMIPQPSKCDGYCPDCDRGRKIDVEV